METLRSYQPVRSKRFAPSRKPFSVESRYWKSFSSKDILQQIAGVSCVQFCPEPPHDFAVTSSTRVTVYDGETSKVKKTISRFSDMAYSGVFRPDGRLLVAGGEMGLIQVFDINSRLILRQLKGHTRAVHWVRYSPLDKLHVLSGSDDNTVRWWDVEAQVELLKMEGHTDYVRCGSVNPSSSDLWATGAYDHMVRLWDLRTSTSILQLQHGKPLEDVLFYPSGGLLVTAGGNMVKIWDVLGGGRLLHVLGSHQKTVTSLCFTPPIKPSHTLLEASPRLLTGSLDAHVKVFEVNNFKVTHATRYPAPILSLDFSQSATSIAVGMTTGQLFIRKQEKTGSNEIENEDVSRLKAEPKLEKVLHPNNYRYFLRGRTEKSMEGDYFVAHKRRPRLAEHDKFFRKFQYREALVASIQSSDPTVVVAVMEELVTRRGLISAISNLDPSSLELLLAFLQKYVTSPKYSRLLVPFAHKVLDKYASDFGLTPSILHQVDLLREKVIAEVRLQESLQCLQGLVQPLIQASVQ